MMMYGETFYGCHTAQHQLQQSKIKVKKIAFGNKEHTKSRKSEIHGVKWWGLTGRHQLVRQVIDFSVSVFTASKCYLF